MQCNVNINKHMNAHVNAAVYVCMYVHCANPKKQVSLPYPPHMHCERRCSQLTLATKRAAIRP